MYKLDSPSRSSPSAELFRDRRVHLVPWDVLRAVSLTDRHPPSFSRHSVKPKGVGGWERFRVRQAIPNALAPRRRGRGQRDEGLWSLPLLPHRGQGRSRALLFVRLGVFQRHANEHGLPSSRKLRRDRNAGPPGRGKVHLTLLVPMLC